MIYQWIKGNIVQRKIISEQPHLDQLRAMLFKDSPWSSELQQQLRVTLYLKDIFISSYGFIPSNMSMTPVRCNRMRTFWRNIGRMHTIKTNCGKFCFKAQGAFHYLNVGDKKNIIDDFIVFLFIIWLDGSRGIHWEEFWVSNNESLIASYEMYIWTTW